MNIYQTITICALVVNIICLLRIAFIYRKIKNSDLSTLKKQVIKYKNLYFEGGELVRRLLIQVEEYQNFIDKNLRNNKPSLTVVK